MLELKPTTDDCRLKTNVLLREKDALQQVLSRCIKEESYRQHPSFNNMYKTEQQIENIMNTPSMIPDEKSALYSYEY